MVLFRVRFCTKVCIFLLQQHYVLFNFETRTKSISDLIFNSHHYNKMLIDLYIENGK